MGNWPSPNNDPTVSSVIGNVGGIANVWQPADATLTRPNNATPYASTNAIGSSTSVLWSWSNFFRANGGSAVLTGARLVAHLSGIATSEMGGVRLHLFNQSPSAAAGVVDQGTWNMLYADEAFKLGWIDFSSWQISGSGSDEIVSYGSPCVTNLQLIGAALSSKLFGVLEATGAFTPGASMLLNAYLAALLD